MALCSDSVTLEKSYFETLLRKAQFHAHDGKKDYSTPLDLQMVTITKEDYDGLLKASREYGLLCRKLFECGLTEEALSILVNSADTALANGSTQGGTNSTVMGSESGSFFTQPTNVRNANASTVNSTGPSSVRNAGRKKNGHNHGEYHDLGNPYDESTTDSSYQADMTPGSGQLVGGFFKHDTATAPSDGFAKNCQRTIVFRNLPNDTTHADIMPHVKGGLILDVFLRRHDHACSVSFLFEEDATAFYRYAKRRDIYIRGRRIDIVWAERSFVLQNNITNKIRMGATRNLVIKSSGRKHTEEDIRDDLDHIHNLIVITVKFEGASIIITTNSVQNALFAKTCMMSRQKYKGCRIDWAPDECDVDIPSLKQNAGQNGQRKTTQDKPSPLLNRFALLDLENSTSAGVASDDDETATTVGGTSQC